MGEARKGEREESRKRRKERGICLSPVFLCKYYDFYTHIVVSNCCWLPQDQYTPAVQIKSELRSNPLSALKSTHCQIPWNNRVLPFKLELHHPSSQSNSAFTVVSICWFNKYELSIHYTPGTALHYEYKNIKSTVVDPKELRINEGDRETNN